MIIIIYYLYNNPFIENVSYVKKNINILVRMVIVDIWHFFP